MSYEAIGEVDGLGECTPCGQAERAARAARIRYGYARAAGLEGFGDIEQAAAGFGDGPDGMGGLGAAPPPAACATLPAKVASCGARPAAECASLLSPMFRATYKTKCGTDLPPPSIDCAAHAAWIDQNARQGNVSVFRREKKGPAAGQFVNREYFGVLKSTCNISPEEQLRLLGPANFDEALKTESERGPNYALWAAGAVGVGLVLYLATRKKGRR